MNGVLLLGGSATAEVKHFCWPTVPCEWQIHNFTSLAWPCRRWGEHTLNHILPEGAGAPQVRAAFVQRPVQIPERGCSSDFSGGETWLPPPDSQNGGQRLRLEFDSLSYVLSPCSSGSVSMATARTISILFTSCALSYLVKSNYKHNNDKVWT